MIFSVANFYVFFLSFLENFPDFQLINNIKHEGILQLLFIVEMKNNDVPSDTETNIVNPFID